MESLSHLQPDIAHTHDDGCPDFSRSKIMLDCATILETLEHMHSRQVDSGNGRSYGASARSDEKLVIRELNVVPIRSLD
jgi:hypothetical protein